MAEVTGFTAARMLVIENETVVDGEIQGDDLVLLTREGTPINAGNVRGPAGPTGPSGGVASVNGQTGTVSAPRIFASLAAVNSDWASAPVGSMAVTTDSGTVWEKTTLGGWVMTNPFRTFATAAALTAQWVNAPNGSRATTVDTGANWVRMANEWVMDNGVRAFTSVIDRDAKWPTPPNGSLCITTDFNVEWQRIAGVWKALGPLAANGARIDTHCPTAPVHDVQLSIPAVSVDGIITISAVIYGGYAPGTITMTGALYTNGYQGGDSAALMTETPSKTVSAATWSKLGFLGLTYPVAAYQGHGTYLRITWSGVASCYLMAYWNYVIQPV